MFVDFNEAKRYGSWLVIVFAFISIFASGLFFGVTYYLMDITESNFKSVTCVIDNNSLVSSCQELFNLALYPFLALREILVWLSFFFIMTLVIGMLVMGYRSGKSPTLMGVLVLFMAGLTYLGIEISNMYRTMLDNLLFRNMMVTFTVYNKVMLYFPWFCFFVGLFSITLGLVNFQRAKINTPTSDLDY